MANDVRPTPYTPRPASWNRWDWIILAAVTALGAALRLYQLGELPPGFQFDEAFNAIDAKQVLAGHTPLFLPANGGREALYTYWQAALGALFGVNVYTLRLASAIAGILTIPAAYLLLRGLLRRNSRYIAAFTSLTLAISLWHIHFSRYGIRVIMMPLILSGAMGLFWLGGHAATRRWRLISYVGSGILVGLTPWTHPSGRLVPFILLFYVGWMLWRQPSTRSWKPDGIVGGLAITGLTAFLVFLPLGFEFLRNPDFFFGHASEVSIFAERVSGGNPWTHLLDNVLHVAGMFSFYGDLEWAHNLAGRPVFDLLMAAVFTGGFFIWIGRLRRRDDPDFDALSLLAIWVLVMLLPSVLSEAAPNYSRTMPSLPATFVAAGLGLTWIVTYQWPFAWLGPVAAAVILIFSTGSTVYDYFVRFAQSPEVYYLYDADKLDALDHLAQYADEDAVYISQLWGEKHSTVYLLRGRLGIESIDTSDTIVLPPPGKDAVYGFPAEQHNRAEALADYWPEATVEPVLDHFGNSLISVVHVPASALQGWPADATPTNEFSPEDEAHFFEAPTLLGMQSFDNSSQLNLFWRNDGFTYRDLTTFIHLIDADGRRVGQTDKLPGNGSYRTPFWREGERVIDRYYPEVEDLCAGGEEVRVQVGWYQYLADNMRMQRTDAPGDSALAGYLTLPLVSQPIDRFAPDTLVEQAVNDDLTLLGYSADGQDWQPGSPLRIDLVWAGGAQSAETPIQLVLDGDELVVLWSGSVAEDATWDDGEALCRRLRTSVPPDTAPGVYRLQIESGDNTIDLGEVTIAESTRQYELPPVANESGVTFGDQIVLAGYDSKVTETGQLAVTLAWQALRRPEPESHYQVFLHLLDEDGQIVAQSDAAPGGGYATSQWLPQEVVIDTHTLVLPAGADRAAYRLRVGLYDPLSGERLIAIDESGQSVLDNAAELKP